jgi:DNA-binding transcriptional ArsR family regulator
MLRASSNATLDCPPPGPVSGGIATTEGGEARPVDWAALVSLLVHPLKVDILETMSWIDRPLSASDLTKLIDSSEYRLSHVAYHVRRLSEAKAIKKVRKRQVRGATETFFRLR